MESTAIDTKNIIMSFVLGSIVSGLFWDFIKCSIKTIYYNKEKLKPLEDPLSLLLFGLPSLGIFGGGGIMMLINLYQGKTMYTLDEMFGTPLMMVMTLVAFLLIGCMTWHSAKLTKKGIIELISKVKEVSLQF